MTTYDPEITQSTGSASASASEPAAPLAVQTVKRGPGWGTYFVTIVALVVVAAVVVLQNTQRINIKFYSWKQANVKTAAALGAAAVGGLIAGLFLGLIPGVAARRKLRHLRKGGVI